MNIDSAPLKDSLKLRDLTIADKHIPPLLDESMFLGTFTVLGNGESTLLFIYGPWKQF